MHTRIRNRPTSDTHRAVKRTCAVAASQKIIAGLI
jgi:hypothetical protein